MRIPPALPPPPFGEFLVERQALDRFQLFRALQLQDRVPTARVGECAAALGFVGTDILEAALEAWAEWAVRDAPDDEAMMTMPFSRDEIEIIREPEIDIIVDDEPQPPIDPSASATLEEIEILFDD